ncbi:unnamed protein product [Ilex paraguariensis]|uniref:Uncharacterized protein n=1 Tax=Ilex paraguariensis TaxID=185542 RepID=A0ABC8S279_9AQUA
MDLEKARAIQSRIDDFTKVMSDLLLTGREAELEFTREELNVVPTPDKSSNLPKPIEFLGAGATSCMQRFVNNLGEGGCSIIVALESRYSDPTFSKLFGKGVHIDRIHGLADALTYEACCLQIVPELSICSMILYLHGHVPGSQIAPYSIPELRLWPLPFQPSARNYNSCSHYFISG